MKKLVSILCAMCLIVGCLAHSFPAEHVLAGEGAEALTAAQITAFGMADPNEYQGFDIKSMNAAQYESFYDEYDGALTFGGEFKWWESIVAIELPEGVSVTSVKGKNSRNEDSSLEVAYPVVDFGTAWDGLISKTSEDKIPDDIKTLANELKGKTGVKAVAIDAAIISALFFDVCGGGSILDIQLSDGTGCGVDFGWPESQAYRPDDAYHVGDVVDLQELLVKYFPDRSADFADLSAFDITVGYINSAITFPAVEKEGEPGKYELVAAGNPSWVLYNKQTGYRYELVIGVILDAPFYIKDIALPEGTKYKYQLLSDTVMNANVCASDGVMLKNFEFVVPLSDGISFDWDGFKTQGAGEDADALKTALQNGEEYQYSFYGDSDTLFKLAIKAEPVSEGMKISLRTIEGPGIVDTIYFSINNGSKIDYFISVAEAPIDEDFWSSMSGISKTFIPGAEVSVFDLYTNIPQSKHAEFIQYVNEGKIYLNGITAEGMSFLYENGVFKGNVVINRPFNYLSLMQRPYGMLNGGEFFVSLTAKTIVAESGTVDIRALLNGYGSDDIEVFNAKGESISVSGIIDENLVFTAPSLSGETPETYTVKLYEGTWDGGTWTPANIYVTVAKAENFDNTLSDIIKDLAEGEGDEEDKLIVDSSFTDGAVSEVVIESLKVLKNKNKEKVTVTFEANGSTHDVTWSFKSKDMFADDVHGASNIKLDVKVGDELNMEILDDLMADKNVSGIKLGFEENGILPGEATVRVYLSDEEIAALNGSTMIQLYYYDEGVLKKEGAAYYIKEDEVLGKKYIDVKVRHNSTFVLSSATAETIGGTATPTPQVTPIPVPDTVPAFSDTAAPAEAVTPTPDPEPAETSEAQVEIGEKALEELVAAEKPMEISSEDGAKAEFAPEVIETVLEAVKAAVGDSEVKFSMSVNSEMSDALAALAGAEGAKAPMVIIDPKIEVNNQEIHELGGIATLSVTIPEELKGEKLAVIHIRHDKTVEKLQGKIAANGLFTFKSASLSEFAIMSESSADAVMANYIAANEMNFFFAELESGKNSITVSWSEVEGADRYDIYAAALGHKVKKIGTVNTAEELSFTYNGLGKKAYKFYVKAYAGKKHLATSYKTIGYTLKAAKTNVKTIKLNKSKVTVKPEAAYTLQAVLTNVFETKKLLDTTANPSVRFVSSNEAVATVDAGGVITGVNKGTCTVYAIAENGLKAEVKVKVK